jgi:prophage antirepressor-like protein
VDVLSPIIPYTFPETGTPVRIVTIDGEPWWVARDVCTVLDIKNSRDAVARLDADGVGQTDVIDSLGRKQIAAIVNEAGLYELIIRSDRPQARTFRRWITAEVLPSIRRSGSYSVVPAAPALPDITTPQGVLALAQQFARTAEQLVEADAKLRELEPKALAHDTLMAAQDGDVLVREAAKVLGWQERQLRAFLLDEHLIYRRQATCGQSQYDFYAANAPHFNAVVKVVSHTWGECAHYTLHVTPRGMELIQKRIAKRQAEMRDAIGGAA